MSKKIIFVTGTDTGSGKTVLTALLLAHLRGRGIDARAIKPFCSGSRADAEILWRLQEKIWPLDTVNPFYFDKPLAPLAAVMGGRGKPAGALKTQLPRLQEVVRRIKAAAADCQVLLVEGSGGLMVPLGRDYTVADLIGKLGCKVLLSSRNRLGTINHTVLTINALRLMMVRHLAVVMMGEKRPDLASKTNVTILRRMAPGTEFCELKYLGYKRLAVRQIKKDVTFLKITLARIVDGAKVWPVLSPQSEKD